MNTGFGQGYLVGYLVRKTKILRISRIPKNFAVNLAIGGSLKKNIMNTEDYADAAKAL